MLVEEAGRGETAEECLRIRREVQELRDECEDKMREAREKREEEFRGLLRSFR